MDELADELEALDLQDESNFLSPTETGSTTSSDNILPGSELGRRFKLNAFLEECKLQPIERPWLRWDQTSERTRKRYVERSAEIVSSVLNVIYPGAAVNIWDELQKSSKMLGLLGVTSAGVNHCYLEALSEAYKNATGWDTRRQVLSIMAGIASFKDVSEYIPGVTQYRYTMANTHRQQYGRAVPVPKKEIPRLRVERSQLDHFLCFITSPHLVQDLPFGETELKLSSGKIIPVPNIIRTMVPQRIVNQYRLYCEETSFQPLSDRTLLRILQECSASVRKSLQGLHNFAADGGKACQNLLDLLENISHLNCDEDTAAKLKEALKAGKLYLKGDYKVCKTDDRKVCLISTGSAAYTIKSLNQISSTKN